MSPQGKTFIGWIVVAGGDFLDPYYGDSDADLLEETLHPGEDWNGTGLGDTDRGQPVYAAADGLVIFAGDGGCNWGNIILIEHTAEPEDDFRLPDESYVNRLWTQYAHLETISPRILEEAERGLRSKVTRRERIGTIGKGIICDRDSAGNIVAFRDYPAHLHFEVRTKLLSASYWPSAYGKDAEWIGDNYVSPSQFVELNRAGACPFSVGQDALTNELRQVFELRYDDVNERDSLGCAISSVKEGNVSFRGTKGIFQVFSLGAIEYHDAIGDRDPNGQPLGSALVIGGPFYDRWSRPICDGTTVESGHDCPASRFAAGVLGYPVADASGTLSSHHGTLHRFQRFEGGSIESHLNGSQAGLTVEIHGAIFSKRASLGFAEHHLGLPTSDEREALVSPQYSTGRVSDFENGFIHWNRGTGQAFETHGPIATRYVELGGTASCLGFPTSDVYEIAGGQRANFEGGTITLIDGAAGVICGATPVPDLTISKLASPDPVDSGGPLNYHIRVENIGDGVAEEVKVTDLLPSAVQFHGCSVLCSANAGAVTVELGTLSPRATELFNIDVVAPIVQDPLQITNEVTVSTSSNEADTENNYASAAVTVASASPKDLTQPFKPVTFFDLDVPHSSLADLATDSGGNVLAVTSHYSGSCGFNVCGDRIHSIAPSGLRNWMTPDNTDFVTGNLTPDLYAS
jgi:uncharacterized repeat protein (TIGR01451 family)